MKITKMQIVEECKKFGQGFLGTEDVTFDVLKDTKKWKNFLRKNQLDGKFFLDQRPGQFGPEWFLVCMA